MPPKLFTVDGEKFLMEQFEKIWVQSSGSTLKAAEKYELVAQRVNDAGKKEGWLPVTAKIVDNKIDSLRKKGRKVYNAFRKATRTGAPCPDDFDLEGAYKEWINFKLYHRLFFKHQSFGPGGYNVDTASGDEVACEDSTATLADRLQAHEDGRLESKDAGNRKRKHVEVSDDSDVETTTPGKKPHATTTRRRSPADSASTLASTMSTLQREMLASEDTRALEMKKFEAAQRHEMREWEDKRDKERREEAIKNEQERRDYDEKREKERREYEEKREAERTKEMEERRRSDKEFNALLLSNIFNRKE